MKKCDEKIVIKCYTCKDVFLLQLIIIKSNNYAKENVFNFPYFLGIFYMYIVIQFLIYHKLLLMNIIKASISWLIVHACNMTIPLSYLYRAMNWNNVICFLISLLVFEHTHFISSLSHQYLCILFLSVYFDIAILDVCVWYLLIMNTGLENKYFSNICCIFVFIYT